MCFNSDTDRGLQSETLEISQFVPNSIKFQTGKLVVTSRVSWAYVLFWYEAVGNYIRMTTTLAIHSVYDILFLSVQVTAGCTSAAHARTQVEFER